MTPRSCTTRTTCSTGWSYRGQGKTNFERRVSEYQKAGVMSSTDTKENLAVNNSFALDADV